MFAVRKLSAAQTTQKRDEALRDSRTRALYFIEYETISAEQSYINASQNYAALKGLQGNLYECFLPQAWTYCNDSGVFALIHPESVFNDSKGTEIRKELNARLRKHFRFSNALKLFADVHTSREYGLNVYSNKKTIGFDQIVNLYAASTIDECYENTDKAPVYIRNEDGKRNLKGQRSRITPIKKNELQLFARILDNSDDWVSARLMSVYTEELIDILLRFEQQKKKLADLGDDLAVSMLWDETNAQKDGTIVRDVHFGERIDTILSGAHIGISNPLFNCSNQGCSGNNDNTSIDLTKIPQKYLQRSNYSPACDIHDYLLRLPDTAWGNKYTDNYRIAGRKMIDLEGERTLMTALLPPYVGHTNGIIGFAFADKNIMAVMLGAFSSLPYDFFIKVCGKGNLQMNTAGMLPVIEPGHKLSHEIVCRAMLLNCLTEYYSEFWESIYSVDFNEIRWSKVDRRLDERVFTGLNKQWTYHTPARDAFSRRQLMVEIDVLVAMVLGMTLDQLLAAYRIQFPILQQHEKDTYYDVNGTIVYAKNNALTGVGVARKTFENILMLLPNGKMYRHSILDDTLPGGPVERTIEYVAPFDRCNREQDYETAWKFFEEKYGK